jgi:hypothetical protein
MTPLNYDWTDAGKSASSTNGSGPERGGQNETERMRRAIADWANHAEHRVCHCPACARLRQLASGGSDV